MRHGEAMPRLNCRSDGAGRQAFGRQPPLDMPASAIASGCIDFILSPENIAGEIIRITQPDT
jgi:chemotaxis response regulator CheB